MKDIMKKLKARLKNIISKVFGKSEDREKDSDIYLCGKAPTQSYMTIRVPEIK